MFVFEFLNDPQRVHAALVHLPVALALLGIPLVYLTAVVPSEKDGLRWLTLTCYALLILLAFAGVWTGERASAQVPPDIPVPTDGSSSVYDVIEKHEWMAEQIWIPAAATAVLLALSAIRLRWFRAGAMALAMTASLGTGAWVAVTGHYGGELVYEHGIGTPGRALNKPLPAAGAVPSIPTLPKAPVSPPGAPAPIPAPIVATPAPPAPQAAPPAPVPAPEAAPVAPATPPVAEITPAPSPAPAPQTTPAPAPEPAPEAPPAPSEPAPAPPATPDAAPAPKESSAPAPAAEYLPSIRPIDPEAAAKVSYLRDIKPIVEDLCMDCHDGENSRGDLSLSTVSDMLKPGKKSGPGIMPFKPDDSSIVQYIRGIKQPKMPRKRDPLTEDQLHLIRQWISAGAVDDSQFTPAPEAAPKAAPETAPAPAPTAPSESDDPVRARREPVTVLSALVSGISSTQW